MPSPTRIGTQSASLTPAPTIETAAWMSGSSRRRTTRPAWAARNSVRLIGSLSVSSVAPIRAREETTVIESVVKTEIGAMTVIAIAEMIDVMTIGE